MSRLHRRKCVLVLGGVWLVVGTVSAGGDPQVDRSPGGMVARLVAQYASGQFDQVVTALEQVEIGDWPALGDAVRDELPRWPVVVGTAFALEVAAAAKDVQPALSGPMVGAIATDTSAVRVVGPIVRAACERFTRAPAPPEFAIDWHLAASALLQGVGTVDRKSVV